MKMTEQELRGEVLCLKCREMVEDVFQLHYQLQEKKDKIVNMVKKTLELRKDDIDSDLDEMDLKKERKISRKESLGDEVYNIELLKEKKGDKFLVKWENFSEYYNSWEPRKSIPEDIVKFYEDDSSRLGHPFPQESLPAQEIFEVDKILDKRESGKNVEYLVRWKGFDDPSEDTWEPADSLESAFKLIIKFETGKRKVDSPNKDKAAKHSTQNDMHEKLKSDNVKTTVKNTPKDTKVKLKKDDTSVQNHLEYTETSTKAVENGLDHSNSKTNKQNEATMKKIPDPLNENRMNNEFAPQAKVTCSPQNLSESKKEKKLEASRDSPSPKKRKPYRFLCKVVNV